MRNFNTSSIKNAIRFFASDANQVLGNIACANPAYQTLRLIQSCVRSLLEHVETSLSGLPLGQPEYRTAGKQGTSVSLAMSSAGGRNLSVMFGGLDPACGKDRWDSRFSHSRS